MNSKKPRIVCIGGGTGLSTLLRGLKALPIDLSVIVTVTDDGGSSGRLREELRALPPGDIRNCMMALSEDEHLMSQLFRFRFNSDGGLHNHSFGNLFLTAMAGVTGDFAVAVRLTSEVLAIKGVIYPSTNSNVRLRGELEDGSLVEGETRITAQRKRIRRIQLNPADAQPLPDALEAIAKADLITIGPGSLYTSLIPNMLVQQVTGAVRASQAKKIYIQNIMTQPGETDGYTAADHVVALAEHCEGILFPNVLLNDANPSVEVLEPYRAESAALVEIDRDRLRGLGLNLVERQLLADDSKIRHDPDRLARAVLEMANL
ncbi:MAG TPA: gluconeogenesis factor YvcK family protein [Terriglobia bacterium]|nr:gluconeogenesis factor YvcK family protein [Terriglobia bacterium]